MRSLKQILPKFMLAYCYILVCSIICFYTEIQIYNLYEVNMRWVIIYLSKGFTIYTLEVILLTIMLTFKFLQYCYV